jgi:hypothetical protein
MVALPAYPIRRQLIQGLSVCIVPTSGSVPVAPLFVLLLDELNISPYRANQARSRGNLTAARSKITDFRNQVSAQTGRSISPAAAQLLIADADYVIGTLH